MNGKSRERSAPAFQGSEGLFRPDPNLELAAALGKEAANPVITLEELLEGSVSTTLLLGISDHNLFDLVPGLVHNPHQKSAAIVLQKNEPYNPINDPDAPEWLKEVGKRAREKSSADQYAEQYIITIHPEAPLSTREKDSLILAFGLDGSLLKMTAARRTVDASGEFYPTGSRDLIMDLDGGSAKVLASAIVDQIRRHGERAEIQSIS